MDGLLSWAGSCIEAFQQSPWGFIAFWVGFAGAVMAIPSFLQMFYGRPKLEMKFTASHNSKDLMCEILNSPIGKKWVRWFGVKKESAEGVTCTIELIELRRDRCIKFYGDIDTGDSSPTRRATIPPSKTPSFVTIVKVMPNREVRLTDKERTLLQGVDNYIVKVTIEAGEDIYMTDKVLAVTQEGLGAHWEHALRSN